MAITDKTEFKAKAEEYTAVANAIRVLMGQPTFGSENYDSTADAYIWTTDYIAKLTQIKTILERLSNIIGGNITGDGPVDEIKEKIEDVQEQINNIIDPGHTQRDESINDTISDIEDLVDRLDDIVDGDPTQPTGQTPAELIDTIEGDKEVLEEIVDPEFDPTTDNRPLDNVVNDIKDAIDDIRDIVPNPEIEPGDPDNRTIDEVVKDVNDVVDLKDELQDLINSIEEIIHHGAIITGEEDPDSEQGESIEASKEYINNAADEVYEIMDEQGLEWEDLTDDQKLIIVLDDLLDYIEGLEAEVEEYRNGGFQLIETSSAVSGSGIFDTIQNLETARRATMTPEQKEEEKTVVYISRCLFNTTESFICTGLIDGVRKNGAFFYRDSATNNFYNTSAPTSNAKLGAGKYLIRVILREEAYFNAEI